MAAAPVGAAAYFDGRAAGGAGLAIETASQHRLAELILLRPLIGGRNLVRIRQPQHHGQARCFAESLLILSIEGRGLQRFDKASDGRGAEGFHENLANLGNGL